MSVRHLRYEQGMHPEDDSARKDEGSWEGEGARRDEGAQEGEGARQDEGAREGSAGDDAPGGPSVDLLMAELVSMNAMLEEAGRSLVLEAACRSLAREERSRVFSGPATTTAPVGMATDEQLDSFRELRTRLVLMASGKGLTHFTTLVVAMSEDSGASFVARNLAAALAMEENRIALLIDCNFRKPTQHEALGMRAGGEGLFDFLDAPGRPSIGQLILPTGIPGLHFIPAGRRESLLSARQRESFTSTSMKSLMATLRGEPCYVVLDGPPVKGAPDARILSDLADLVVLVVGCGRSTNQAIAQAAAIFDSSKFAGVVFNERVEPASKPTTAFRRAVRGLRTMVTRQGETV